MLRKCAKNGTEIKMLEVIIGLMLGLLIITSVYVITFAVMFPLEFESYKICLEEIQIELEVTMLDRLILMIKLK